MRFHEAECHGKKWHIIAKDKSQGGGLCNQNLTFYYVFQNLDLFASELGCMVHLHNPECHGKKVDGCAQGQGHSMGSECQ